MGKLLLVAILAIAAHAQSRVPVVVELFTSEGCSSCPPADEFLIRLDRDQPIPNADVIVLGEHVDYWNGLGWTDRFSSGQFTLRQNQYARRFHLDSSYTPQMVVNGRVELVGNDVARARDAIAHAARDENLSHAIAVNADHDNLRVTISSAGRRSLDVFCAITERDLSTAVKAGENGGRELHHTGVVRLMRKLGSTRDGSFSANVPLQLAPAWQLQNLRAVVFLQDAEGEILGATQISLR